jgi:hypothetical protein
MLLHTTLKSIFSLAITAITVSVLSPTASAQMEYMSEAMHPAYLSRDLVVFAEGLNLDDTQEVIIDALFDSYTDDFELGWASTQERLNRVAAEMKENPPTDSKATLEPVLNALGDWLQEKRKLDQGLLENVQTILVGEQRKLWPGFAQRLYREKNISRGRLSGESVDLFVISRDCNLAQVAENIIIDSLAEYADALDVAMRKRDAILRGNPKKLFDNILTGNDERSDSHGEELIKARVEVRDLNDRYTELICSELSPEDSDNFRTRSLKRGYTRIYRRTPAERILRQAAESPNYTPELIIQIVQLENSYLQELQIINHKLLTLTRKHEPEAQLHREQAGQVRKAGGTPQKIEDPTRPVYKDRETLGKEYIEMLRALLSPEQFLELDGSRRWVPRSEQEAIPPSVPGTGPDGGITLKGGKSKSGTKGTGKGKKDKSRPTDSGLNSGSGLGKPGS